MNIFYKGKNQPLYLMIKRLIPLFLTLLLLASCSGEKCIDPDDFGNPTFTISARYRNDELQGKAPNQVAPWRDAGLKTNGRPLVIVVRNWDLKHDKNSFATVSAWSSWFGTNDNKSTIAQIVESMPECQFRDDVMCPSNGSDAILMNAPCIFKRGVGLYALIAERGSNPNETKEKQHFPDGIAFHVGEPQNGYSLYTTNKRGRLNTAGGIVFKYEVPPDPETNITPPPEQLKERYYRSNLFFKILDRDYTDNSGQYKVIIKSGVDVARDDPLELITRLVKESLFGSGERGGVIKNLYQGITERQPAYKTIVRALLTLYILFTAFSFLIGSMKLTNAELITRVLKVIVVSILLTTNESWNFFNDYLFVYFIDGTEYILQIISNAVSGGGWGKLPLLQVMISPQTLSKLFSLTFVSWEGFGFVVLYMCLLFLVILISIQATIIYLTSLLVVGLLIVLGPIFITFLLFDFTKSLFENWIRLLIAYAFQPIILFAGMGLLSLLLLQEIYATLGFRVCQQPIFKFADDIVNLVKGDLNEGDSVSLFSFWFPYPRDRGSIDIENLVDIPIPYDHYYVSDHAPINNSIVDAPQNGTFCQAYECIGKRVPDLPYLNPRVERDRERLENFRDGKFIDTRNLLIFIIAIFLLNKFNSITISLAQILSGTSGKLTDFGGATTSAYNPVASYLQDFVKSIPMKFISGTGNILKRFARPQRTLNFINNKFNKAKTSALNSLYNQQFQNSSLMPKQVRLLAEQRSGIKYESLNMQDYKAYKASLKELFSDAKVKGHSATALAKMSMDDLYKELAMGKFGKDPSELTKSESLELKNLVHGAERKMGKTFKEAKENLKNVEAFQKAYMEAHEEMTKNGMGFFRKHSETVNSLHDVKEKLKDKYLLKSKQELKEMAADKNSAFYKRYDAMLEKLNEQNPNGDYGYYDYKNSRMLTYGEEVIESALEKNMSNIEKEINLRTVEKGEDVVSPHHLAKLENTANVDDALYYKELAQEEIRANVYRSLTSSNDGDPILMGRRYMSERMSDEEFKESIDKAYDLQERLIKEDIYLADKEDYTNRLGAARFKLEQSIAKVEDPKIVEEIIEGLDNGTLTKQEIKELLQDPRYDELKYTIEDYQEYRAVLENINEREQMIEAEVGTYINEINEFRKKAELPEYKPYSHQDKSDASTKKPTKWKR
ncbi:MAG: VirB6 [Rickettsiaceae bacterium]|nr:VirB6 [Rickettsiaceae bacterium]